MKYLIWICLLIGYSMATQAQNSMDLPKEQKAIPDTLKKMPKDTLKHQKPPSSPLEKALQKNHNEQIKAYVKGRAFLMTGRAVGHKDSVAKNSLVFEQYSYTQSKLLDSLQLQLLGKQLSDSTTLKTSEYPNMCVYAPNIGFELTDIKGNTDRFLIAYSCDEYGTWITKDDMQYLEVSSKAMILFKKIDCQLFVPLLPKKSMGLQFEDKTPAIKKQLRYDKL